jgi:hypothetical protein
MNGINGGSGHHSNPSLMLQSGPIISSQGLNSSNQSTSIRDVPLQGGMGNNTNNMHNFLKMNNDQDMRTN